MVKVSCYPKDSKKEVIFIEHIDYRVFEHGKIHSMENERATALTWKEGNKQNRIFFTLDQTFLYKKYHRYLDHLVLIVELHDEIANGKCLQLHSFS